MLCSVTNCCKDAVTIYAGFALCDYCLQESFLYTGLSEPAWFNQLCEDVNHIREAERNVKARGKPAEPREQDDDNHIP